jgi:hypothetical protein
MKMRFVFKAGTRFAGAIKCQVCPITCPITFARNGWGTAIALWISHLRELVALALLSFLSFSFTGGNAAAQYALSPLPPLTPTACQLELAQLAQFQVLPAIAGTGECVAADVVLVQGLILSEKVKVELVPPATVRCSMAEEVARWVREDVVPAARMISGAVLRRLDNLGSYECRSQNRIVGARTSEHGRANALDVGAFRLADGRVLALTDVKVTQAWREALRASACARFSTVLGPGSDGFHEEHIHLDLAEHRGGYKMCQWDVREMPAPTHTVELKTGQPAAALAEPVPLPRPRPQMK